MRRPPFSGLIVFFDGESPIFLVVFKFVFPIQSAIAVVVRILDLDIPITVAIVHYRIEQEG